jgi:hypothetical protein
MTQSLEPMFTPFRVRVYRNLNKKCWSVLHKVKGKGWRLLQHLDCFYLHDATFKVYESGRQRVLKERVKNVHAYVEGYIGFPDNLSYCILNKEIRYNPYECDKFYTDDLRTFPESIKLIHFTAEGKAIQVQ